MRSLQVPLERGQLKWPALPATPVFLLIRSDSNHLAATQQTAAAHHACPLGRPQRIARPLASHRVQGHGRLLLLVPEWWGLVRSTEVLYSLSSID